MEQRFIKNSDGTYQDWSEDDNRPLHKFVNAIFIDDSTNRAKDTINDLMTDDEEATQVVAGSPGGASQMMAYEAEDEMKAFKNDDDEAFDAKDEVDEYPEDNVQFYAVNDDMIASTKLVALKKNMEIASKVLDPTLKEGKTYTKPNYRAIGLPSRMNKLAKLHGPEGSIKKNENASIIDYSDSKEFLAQNAANIVTLQKALKQIGLTEEEAFHHQTGVDEEGNPCQLERYEKFAVKNSQGDTTPTHQEVYTFLQKYVEVIGTFYTSTSSMTHAIQELSRLRDHHDAMVGIVDSKDKMVYNSLPDWDQIEIRPTVDKCLSALSTLISNQSQDLAEKKEFERKREFFLICESHIKKYEDYLKESNAEVEKTLTLEPSRGVKRKRGKW